MKKTATRLLVVLALGASALTLTAFRHHGDPARMERMLANRVEDLLDDVKATDAQRQQILAIKDRLVSEGKELRASHRGTHEQALALWNSERPDPAAVHALVDRRADAMQAFANRAADAMLEVHALLTPEQRAVVARKMQRYAGE